MSYNLDPKKLTNEDWLFNNCRERSFYIIENSPKTEFQLRRKLKMSKKYPDDIIEKTIVFLKQHKYIDDIAFTERFIEINKNIKSKKQIISKLYEKGISRDIIDNAINKLMDEFDDLTIAKKFLLKKCPNYYEIHSEMDRDEKNKLYGYLARKGLSYESISSVMRVEL